MSAALRILHVLETSGGGSGRHVLDLASQSIALGHSVHVVYSGRRMEEAFARRLQSLSCEGIARIDMHRAPHPRDFIALRSMRAYLSRNEPFDVIHGHSSKGGALVRLAAVGQASVRVYTPHALMTLDPSLSRVSRYAYAMAEWCLQHLADGIVLVSEEERAHALAVGLAAHKLFVVPNGVTAAAQGPHARERVRAGLGIQPPEICIGFVGRLERQKAPQRAIRAFAELARVFPHTRLVVLGDGAMASTLRGMTRDLGCEHRISWLTGVDGPALMPALDVFLMPSLYEAFPYVLLEAAAAGLPIVATPVGGARAIVSHGANGYIVAHNKPEELIGALTELIHDPDLRRRMGRASLETAHRFTIEAMSEQTFQIYRQLLAARASRPSN